MSGLNLGQGIESTNNKKHYQAWSNQSLVIEAAKRQHFPQFGHKKEPLDVERHHMVYKDATWPHWIHFSLTGANCVLMTGCGAKTAPLMATWIHWRQRMANNAILMAYKQHPSMPSGRHQNGKNLSLWLILVTILIGKDAGEKTGWTGEEWHDHT